MLTHHLHLARLQVSDAGQAELLRAALPLALGQALDELQPEGGAWLLLRRVPAVQLVLGTDADLHEAVARLLPGLRGALQAALADPAEAVLAADAASLRAESWADALAGRADRAWAWQRLGLWPTEGDMPRAARLSHALALLDRELPDLPDAASGPQRRRVVLTALLSRGLLPRWLTIADATHWARLSLGLPGAAPLAALVATALDGSPAAPLVTTAGSRSGAWPTGATAATVRATWCRTPLPDAARPLAALHLAWVAGLLADPLALQGASASARLSAWSQTLLADQAAAPPATPRSTPTGVAGIAAQRTPAAPADPAPARHWPTAHAGLLHLLAALPQRLSGELDAGRLLRLAHHGLHIPLDDAVLAVLLGQAEAGAPLREPEPTPWHTAADRLALDEWLGERLQRHLPLARLRELPADVLGWLVRRDARLHPEPGGWCAHVAEADPLLRRSGLDRDPGHLPWLGLSVRLVYGGDPP